MGGLHIIGTERHEARRIDLQLRGRCGRQGDPGSSRFYLSLEDDLMRIFAGEWVKNILTRLGMKEGEAIESRMVSRRIEGAQKKVEERNFDIRKNLLEYDEVMDEQRQAGLRLPPGDPRRRQLQAADPGHDRPADRAATSTSSSTRTTAPRPSPSGRASELAVEFDARDFRGMDFERAETTPSDQAERMAEGQVLDAIEENLPEEAEQTRMELGGPGQDGQHAAGI